MPNKTNNRNLMIIAKDVGFEDRIKYAMINAALAVMSEDGQTPSHAQRVTYAKLILSGTASVYEVAISVLNNSTISTEADITMTVDSGFAIPDSDIQFAVNSDYNALAGVST